MNDTRDDINRLYMCVTLEPPEVLYDWFLQER